MKVWHVCIVVLVLSSIRLTAGKALMDENCSGSNKQVDDKEAPFSKRSPPSLEEDDHHFKSHQKYKRRRSLFGLVYKDGKPIGILEPISRIYEFQNFQDDLNLKSSFNKREMDVNPNTGEDTYVKRDIDRLESDNVLRSFRMNPHQAMLDDSTLIKAEQKRNVIDPILQKDQIKGDSKLSAIENNLKEIISDLNTISADDEDSDLDKREVLMEDEDLDNGANKIGLTKETHGKQFEAKGLSSEMSIKEKKSINAKSNQEEAIPQESKKIADYRNEGESFIRQKRQQASASKQDVNDIVKGLEASGDLTVSGNKSPLASASVPVEAESKKGKGYDFEKREKQAAEDSDYEKRLQRNIQNKISEIKEQVKREIQALATNKKSVPVPNVNAGDNKDYNDLKQIVQDKSIDVHDPEVKVRQKRNLLEQDSEELDISQNTESESLKSHIRQKRGAEEDVENNSKLVELNQVPRQSVSVEKAKRNDETSGRRDSLGFGQHPIQNQNTGAANIPAIVPRAAEHVHATKDLTPIASVVGSMDAEKLEKLVEESASLTESIKSERAANFPVHGPHIEVELHGREPNSAKEARVDKMMESSAHSADQSVAVAENHADSSDVVINTGPDAVVMKRSARVKQNSEKKSKNFRATDENKEVKAKVEEIEAVSDNSPAPASNSDEHKYKAYKASTKIIPRISDEDAKVLEVRTDSPEMTSNLGADDSKSSSEKEEKEEMRPEVSKVAADHNENDSEDGDLNKRASNQENKVRQERESQPVMSLDDMQAIDSENNMRRRRRRRFVEEYDDYNGRDKRADYDVPPNMPFRNYRGDEDEADDESDEFDDDNFDDRTANLVRKRAAQQLAYEDADNDYEPIAANRMNKRNANARDYVAQMNEDAYDNSNYLYDANGRPLNRNKRQIVDKIANANVAALHSGGPMMSHLAAIRGRNAHLEAEPPHENSRRLGKNLKGGSMKTDQTISGLSDSDIFGALPQSYEGELTRFKRVKRDDPAG